MKNSESAQAIADNETSSVVSADSTESAADMIDAVFSVLRVKKPFVPISLGISTLLKMPISVITNEIINGKSDKK